MATPPPEEKTPDPAPKPPMERRRSMAKTEATKPAEDDDPERKQAAEDAKADAADDADPNLDESYIPPSAYPDLGPGYSRITESIYALADPAELYLDLRNGLSSGFDAGRADYGTLMRELDQSTTNTQRAVELLIDAKTRKVMLELDHEVIMSALRDQAMKRLQKEKKDGERTKAITNGDVEAYLASMFPDEYREVRRGEAEAKGTVDAIESLADRWKERTRALNTMVQTVRS